MSDRYSAFCRLLAMPDAPDLPSRGRRYTQPGTTARDTLKLHLERAYVRHRMQDAGREGGEIVSIRRWPLRLLRRKEA